MFLLLFLNSSFSFGKNSTIKLLKPIYYEILKFEALYGEDINTASIVVTDTTTGNKVWEYQILLKDAYAKSIKIVKKELIVKDNSKNISKIQIPDSLFDLIKINWMLKENPQKNRVELEDYFRRRRNRAEIIFEAKIDTIYIDGLEDREQKFGVNYLTKHICNPKDTCHLIIGYDANFLVKLSNLRYIKNEINLCKPDILYLSVHSPSQSGINDLNKTSSYTFKFCYYNPTDSTLKFSSFQKITTDELNKSAAEK